jgi:hypothetical protein
MSPFGAVAEGGDTAPINCAIADYRTRSIDARTPVAVFERRISALPGVDVVVISLRATMRASAGIIPGCAPAADAGASCGVTATRADRSPARLHASRRSPAPAGRRRQVARVDRERQRSEEWFGELRRRVFDERQPTRSCRPRAVRVFDLLDIPAVSNQWWSSLVTTKRRAPAFLDAMSADGVQESALPLLQPRARDALQRRGREATPRLLCA